MMCPAFCFEFYSLHVTSEGNRAPYPLGFGVWDCFFDDFAKRR